MPDGRRGEVADYFRHVERVASPVWPSLEEGPTDRKNPTSQFSFSVGGPPFKLVDIENEIVPQLGVWRLGRYFIQLFEGHACRLPAGINDGQLEFK